MISPSYSARLIQRCLKYLKTGGQFMFGSNARPYLTVLEQVAEPVLKTIAQTDAAYHDLEHTVQVALVGHEMLQGKQLCDRAVSPSDWLHVMVALVCHDIGYVRSACATDRQDTHHYSTGNASGSYVQLSLTATDASLTPFHVDRGKQFITEQFASHSLLNVERLRHYIEFTRFPVSDDVLYQDSAGYPGLVRAADLLGQLGDPLYLDKIPALFREFEEVGSHKLMGYGQPQDLRAGYPKFYWSSVSQYVGQGMRYLELTQAGRAIVTNLYNNLATVERELPSTSA